MPPPSKPSILTIPSFASIMAYFPSISTDHKMHGAFDLFPPFFSLAHNTPWMFTDLHCWYSRFSVIWPAYYRQYFAVMMQPCLVFVRLAST